MGKDELAPTVCGASRNFDKREIQRWSRHSGGPGKDLDRMCSVVEPFVDQPRRIGERHDLRQMQFTANGSWCPDLLYKSHSRGSNCRSINLARLDSTPQR
jgi:hypothetical protein